MAPSIKITHLSLPQQNWIVSIDPRRRKLCFMSHDCNRCTELSAVVDEVLDRLVRLTKDQLMAFRVNDHSGFMRLDKELELIVDQKERSIGALREHRLEHGLGELRAS